MPWIVLVVALASMASFACRDFTHTNPFDSAAPIELTIVGPDTLWNASDFPQYTFRSVPVITDTTATWFGGSVYFKGDASGGFRVFTPPLYPATDTEDVAVEIGKYQGFLGRPAWRRVFSKTVIVTQRLTQLQLRCPVVRACDTLTVGGAWSVWLDGFDSAGNLPTGLTIPTENPDGTPLATFVSRDATIATVSPVGMRVATIIALKSGTTWVVATRDALRDSLQLVVR